MRHLFKFLGLSLASLAAFVSWCSESQAALVAHSDPLGSAEWELVGSSQRIFYRYRGPADRFDDTRTSLQSSTSSIGGLVIQSNRSNANVANAAVGVPERQGRSAGEESSDGKFVVPVGAPDSMLPLIYSNVVAKNSMMSVILSDDLQARQKIYVDRARGSSVPLPAGVWLFLSALVGLVGVVRYRGNRTI